MPSEVRFAEIRRLLEKYGWRLARTRGSHHTFEKPGFSILVVPVHGGMVMPIYVRKIQKILKGPKPPV
jgi:predicted RNA binding protein YcfA (HicA-like mRNA interferase family)